MPKKEHVANKSNSTNRHR